MEEDDHKEDGEGGEEEEVVSSGAKKSSRNKKQKRFRAHKNVYSPPEVPPPACPSDVAWRTLFPNWREGARVELADVGCGFGGLLEGLSPVWPDKFILGMEIREPVVEEVQKRLAGLVKKNANFGNTGVLCVNAMKYLPNFFERAQLQAMFFLYADPHFKKSKQKNRIITLDLLDVYAYVLAPGGRLYTVTDIEDLHASQVEALTAHPCFVRVSEEQCGQDKNVPVILTATDEAAKAKREGRGQWYSVFQRK